MQLGKVIQTAKHVSQAARRSLHRVRTLRGVGSNRFKLKGSTAEIVARQNGPAGFNRMDLFVMYLAIQEFQGESKGGLALLEKLLQKDPAKRTGDRAILSVLQRDSPSSSVLFPGELVVDSEIRLISRLAPLAMALRTGAPEVAVTLASSRYRQCYDLQWFRSTGFTAEEIAALEAAQQEVFRKLELEPLPWDTLSRIQNEMRQLLPKGETIHGRGNFYQTCEELLIPGQRPTALRFHAYGLASVLKPSDQVLDIGCNCGFFALLSSRHVRAVDGFDISPRFIAIANLAREHLGRENCQFTTCAFEDFTATTSYDIIFSFAVHHWIGLPLAAYAAALRKMLKPGGLVLVESQDLNAHDKDWDEKLRVLCSAGFEEVRGGTLCDDGLIARRHVLLRDVQAVQE